MTPFNEVEIPKLCESEGKNQKLGGFGILKYTDNIKLKNPVANTILLKRLEDTLTLSHCL